MSAYEVMAATSEALRTILWDSIRLDPVTRAIVNNEETIVFKNPTETMKDNANRLSIWLYHVTENEFNKNRPPVRVNDNQSRVPPLAVNLYYLITPFARDGPADHLLLGKTLEILYDNAIVLLDDGDAIAEELTIILCRLSLEELTRIWDALREPYRLSVCYQVKVARIDSTRANGRARVVRRTHRYGKRGEFAEAPA
jgi:hypothetical protein